MSFEEYWKAVTEKFPHLRDETKSTTLSIKGLKALMEQSHERGRQFQTNIHKFKSATKKSGVSDLFKDFY